MLTGRWIIATAIILAGVLVMIRLGFWQLDRLEQRRALNAIIVARPDMAVVSLNNAALPDTPDKLRYRQASVSGAFDYEHEIVLKLQRWRGPHQPDFIDDEGSHLVTPLIISGTNTAVLVNRGWIPEERSTPAELPSFQGQREATIVGTVMRAQKLPGLIAEIDNSPDNPRQDWTHLDVAAIQAQMSYSLLPIILLQSPNGANLQLPYKIQPMYDLSEGSHFSYALQWFSFAIILAGVYIGYVHQHIKSTP